MRFGIGQDFADEINRALHLQCVPCFFPLYNQGGADHLCSGCWWSLSTHLYHQYKSKKERTTCFYTHMPLLQTKFHLYRKICRSAGIYIECKWKVLKRRHSGKCNYQRRERSPTREQNLGQPTSGPRLRPSRRSIAQRRSRGTDTPTPCQTGPRFAGRYINSRRWRCGGVPGNISPKPTRLPYIREGRGASLTHTI
jgi:hypothetical protein